jgi:hypothetical protein
MKGKEKILNSASDPGPIYPFRWDVKARSQLGTRIDPPGEDREAWLNWPELTADAYRWDPAYTYEWFLAELARCAARAIALAGDADLCFVGRSPESLFDYLSGLLFETTWANRLTLLHFSMRQTSWDEHLLRDDPRRLAELRKYLAWLRLSPQALVARERPVAFVDLVYLGTTLGNLVGLIYNWGKEIGVDWSAVQRKIRIIGLTEQTATSPKTWRWQQHNEWVKLLGRGAIKNVSLSVPLYNYLGAVRPKTTLSHDS